MSKLIDLTGKRFGRLLVVSRAENKSGTVAWKCKCDCGNETVVRSDCLRIGKIQSCGCLRNELVGDRGRAHGMTETRLYRTWCGMKSRCYNPSYKGYKNYGGRGITICSEWLHNFQAFYDWAMANGYADNLQIDRIDVNIGYCPENCRWATTEEQSNNKRTSRILSLNGESHTISECSKITGINSRTIESRVGLYGWSDEKALTTPIRKQKVEQA